MTAQQHSLNIDLQGRAGEQFLAMHDDVVMAVQKTVLPYRFDVIPAAQGVQIRGDDVGVLVASRVLDRIARETGAPDVADASSTRAIVSAVVSNMLKMDLAFRLEGLSFPITPMSFSQVAFMRSLREPLQQLIIGIGPTGTGKTHLAIAAALNQLAEEKVKHIVITRPHVVMEGEVLTPAMRQELESDSQFDFFEDILRDLIGYQRFTQLVEQRKVELVPLGHIRGRTFNDTFIILDEAQNMTIRKMRMAVTRIGRASRMVVTGDPTHVDLRGDEPSGLVHLLNLLQGTDIARIHHFESTQIIRNNLVARLEELYAGQQGTSQAFAA